MDPTAPRRPTRPTVLAPAGPVAVRRRRLLLVEDNEDSRSIYRIILEHGGFEVVEALTGPEPLDRARSAGPDLVLLDISIPQVDGWEVARRLKGDPATRGIPIVALTAHALERDRHRAAQVGCDGFLAKPARPQDVLDEVRRRIGSLDAATGSAASPLARPDAG